MASMRLTDAQLYTLQMLVVAPDPDLTFDWSRGGLEDSFTEALTEAIRKGEIDWEEINVDERTNEKMLSKLSPDKYVTWLAKRGLASIVFEKDSPFDVDTNAFADVISAPVYKFFSDGMLQETKVRLKSITSTRKRVDTKNFARWLRAGAISTDEVSILRYDGDNILYEGHDAVWLAGLLGFEEVIAPYADLDELAKKVKKELKRDDGRVGTAPERGEAPYSYGDPTDFGIGNSPAYASARLYENAARRAVRNLMQKRVKNIYQQKKTPIIWRLFR